MVRVGWSGGIEFNRDDIAMFLDENRETTGKRKDGWEPKSRFE